jgi:electron transfer flavoprotein beta subunit
VGCQLKPNFIEIAISLRGGEPMNIVVLVKQVFDTEAKIVIKPDGKIDDSSVTLIMNPYDENAVEEGLLLKEKLGGEVTVVSVGTPKAQDTLRTALAMGADKAVLVSDPALEGADDYVLAQVLAKAVQGLNPDIILTGRVAIDYGTKIASRVAEAMGIPQVNTVTKIEVNGDKAVATREVDGGSELVEVTLPAVFSAQKSLNSPRYPSVAGIMKAKKKELKNLALADLGLAAEVVAGRMKILNYYLPPARKGGRIIPGEPAQAAAELANLLRAEAKVI